MLTLTRKTGEAIRIGPHALRIKRITPTKVELYIDVDADVRVVRGEVADLAASITQPRKIDHACAG